MPGSGVRRIFHVTLVFMTVVAVVCGLALPFGAHGLVEMGIVRDSGSFRLWPSWRRP